MPIGCRYMPVLTMIQEITFKLMTRIKKKRKEMLKSDQILCPNIKKKLDFYVTEARNWNAMWDGVRTYAVSKIMLCIFFYFKFINIKI